MKRTNHLWIQVSLGVTILIILFVGISNLSINLLRTGMGIDFSWLIQPAGFAIAEKLLPYNPSDSYLWAILTGWINSLRIIFFGLIFATVLGVIVGVSRISKNILLRSMASTYIGLIRQTPLLLQLMFWYFVAYLSLADTPLNFLNSLIQITNEGVNLLGMKLTYEFSALVTGLSVFTGASIAEVIRGGINSVPKGQWEAYKSLALPETYGIQTIIFPQALPAIIPALTSQYLNLAKNSTLAIAVGYSDIYAISDTSITQTGRAIEGFLILLFGFLMLNLIINTIMQIVNIYVLRRNNVIYPE